MTLKRLKHTTLLPLAAFLASLVHAEEPGIFVAIGHGLHRMSSNDGVNWTNHVFEGPPKHNQQDLKAIAAGNGACVAVGGFSRSNIYTTTDGINWTKPNFNIGVLSGVIFHKGHFYAFNENGRVAKSEDGIDWESIQDGAFLREHLDKEAAELGLDRRIKSNPRMWAQAHDIFVGAGDNNMILATKDFEKWLFAERKEPYGRFMLKSDGNVFVAASKFVEWSENGVHWHRAKIPNIDSYPIEGDRRTFTDLEHDGERFILTFGRSRQAWESEDGKEWKEIKRATFPDRISLIRPDLYYSHKVFWQYTEDLKISRDGGRSWESANIPAPAGITHIIHLPDFEKF